LIYSCASAAAIAAEPVQAPRLGTPMTVEEAAKWQLNVFPDGKGLPVGKGTAAEGKALFDTQCASCHGEGGRGSTADELVGQPKPPTADDPTKVIGSYWPYATTLYDFIRRSMPPTSPGSLKPDEIYALVAYLLNANGIIGASDTMSNETLAKVQMPNRDGFVWVDVKK
jgi:cytochrome c